MREALLAIFVLCAAFIVPAHAAGVVPFDAPTSVPSCTQSSNFIARANALTTLTSAQENNYARLICGLVTDGSFSSLDTLWTFGGAPTQAVAELNLISTNFSSFTPTGTAPIFSGGGFTGSGAGYLDTGFNAASSGTNFTQNAATVAIWNLTNRVTAQPGGPSGGGIGGHGSFGAPIIAVGSTAGGYETDFYPQYNDGNVYIRVNDNPASGGFAQPNGTNGFFVGIRTSSTARSAYQNDVSLGSFGSTTSGAMPSADFVIGTDAAITADSTDLIAAVAIGGGLSTAQKTSLYNRLNAYLAAALPVPAYIGASFDNSTSQTLQLYNSYDGFNFQTRTTTYTPCNAGAYVRDPALAYFSAQSTMWLVHTSTTGGTATSSFDLASSTDGHTFTCSRQISFSGVISGANAWVIGPQWLRNPDGTPWLDGSGCPHVYAIAGDDFYTGMQMYEVHPTNCSNFAAAWSAPVIVTGTSLPANMVQAYPVVSSTSISVYLCELDGGLSEIGTGLLSGSTSSLTSGFTVAQAANWQGWGTNAQGPVIITLASAVTVGYWSVDGDGPTQQSILSGGTWGTSAFVAGPASLAMTGSVVPTPASFRP